MSMEYESTKYIVLFKDYLRSKDIYRIIFFLNIWKRNKSTIANLQIN